jgi:hypothetical protein
MLTPKIGHITTVTPQPTSIPVTDGSDSLSGIRKLYWINSLGIDMTDSDGVGALFQKLRQNSEFRLLFADQAQKHFSRGGALSLKQSQQRYLNLANQIDKAIVAESARWGDTQASTPYGNRVQQPNPLTNVNHDHYPPAPNAPDIYFTREDSWIVERDNILNHYLPTLHDPSSRFATLNELRNEGLYPNAPAPEFSTNPAIYLQVRQ